LIKRSKKFTSWWRDKRNTYKRYWDVQQADLKSENMAKNKNKIKIK